MGFHATEWLDAFGSNVCCFGILNFKMPKGRFLVDFQAEISSLRVGRHFFLMPFINPTTPYLVMHFNTISILFYKSFWLQALMCHHLGRSHALLLKNVLSECRPHIGALRRYEN